MVAKRSLKALATRQFLPLKLVELKEDGKDSSLMQKTEFRLNCCSQKIQKL
jgi:hypothetical protein